MKWYILQSLAGQEKKVVLAIEEKAEKENLKDSIGEVIIPVEKVVEIKRGKKVDVEKKFLPGYILIKMDMNDNLWHAIKGISKVGGFLGANGKPQEISEKEVQTIMEQIQTSAIARTQAAAFKVGDSVKIKDGPFESFLGTVEDVEESKKRVKVSVIIFGRSTPLDLEFEQVTKV
jgi:transcriptional antiterminator NusG